MMSFRPAITEYGAYLRLPNGVDTAFSRPPVLDRRHEVKLYKARQHPQLFSSVNNPRAPIQPWRKTSVRVPNVMSQMGQGKRRRRGLLSRRRLPALGCGMRGRGIRPRTLKRRRPLRGRGMMEDLMESAFSRGHRLPVVGRGRKPARRRMRGKGFFGDLGRAITGSVRNIPGLFQEAISSAINRPHLIAKGLEDLSTIGKHLAPFTPLLGLGRDRKRRVSRKPKMRGGFVADDFGGVIRAPRSMLGPRMF